MSVEIEGVKYETKITSILSEKHVPDQEGVLWKKAELELNLLSDPVTRMDGKSAEYELFYAWYNPATGGMLGSERSLWTEEEIKELEIENNTDLFTKFEAIS
jgi:hypothetical protein